MTNPLDHIGNVGKMSPEFSTIVEAARVERHEDQYLVHKAYELINAQVAAGVSWTKCANCGSPYVVGGERGWGDATVCSDECFQRYLAYINDPDGSW